MKKGILIILGMFLMVSNTEAKTNNNQPDNNAINYSYNNAVNFIERGIEFYIFTNGDFDFNTNINYNDARVRNNRGVIINKDYRGRITRIGNASINYDFRGNVTRIGEVYMKYRFGKLTNVGDLRVVYDRWGTPNFHGNVRDYYYDNGIRFSVTFGDVFSYNDAYFYRNDFRNNYSKFREDKNYYYYKAKSNARIGNRTQIIRRRKAAPVIKRNNNTEVRRNNNSYRKPTVTNSRRTVTPNTRSNNNSYKKADRKDKVIIKKNVRDIRNSNTKNRIQKLEKNTKTKSSKREITTTKRKS